MKAFELERQRSRKKQPGSAGRRRAHPSSMHCTEVSGITLAFDRPINGANIPQDPLWTEYRGSPIQLLDLADLPPSDSGLHSISTDASPGHAYLIGSDTGKVKRVVIACRPDAGGAAPSWLEVRSVKPAGKAAMDARSWWNGLKVAKGEGIHLG
jgi:hypothetical protein